MRKRIIVGAAVLGAAVCLATRGDEPDRPFPADGARTTRAGDAAGSAAPMKNAERARPPQAPKQRRVARRPAGPHATEAVDLANERTIRAQAEALFADYNAKKAQAFGDQFIPKAEYELNTGEVITGRQAIQDYFAAAFEKSPDLKARLNESKIRLISLHMAIQEGSFTVSGAPEEDEFETPYVAIWTSVEGQWRLASFRELVPEDTTAPATPHEHLQGLAWLVGDWVDETKESVVKTSCCWSEDGNFLLQDFTIKVKGTDAMSGTQRIGWDPLTHKVRAWIFDSRGGHGESFWNWDGERWVIRATAVREDGETTSSINYLIPQGPDTYRWESSHRMSGDNPLPDVSVLIVRQAPPPASTAPGKSDE